MRVKIGDTVKFAAENGSYGEVISLRSYDDDCWLVQWNYGKDVKGEAITARGSVQGHSLLPVDRAWYEIYIAHRAWSPEQKKFEEEDLQKMKEFFS